MLAYMVAGLILGALAWQLKHEPGDPRPATQFIFGVLGAVAGGLTSNFVQGEGLDHLDPYGFTAAVLVSVLGLTALQVRVGR